MPSSVTIAAVDGTTATLAWMDGSVAKRVQPYSAVFADGASCSELGARVNGLRMSGIGLAQTEQALQGTLGGAAKYVWAVGLLAAGQASTMTGVFAGQARPAHPTVDPTVYVDDVSAEEAGPSWGNRGQPRTVHLPGGR